MSEPVECKVEECVQHVIARGMCRLHYQRWWRTGHVVRSRQGVCISDGCERPAVAKCLCMRHYQQERRARRLDISTQTGKSA